MAAIFGPRANLVTNAVLLALTGFATEAIVFILFMRRRGLPPLKRVFAGTGFF